MKKILYNPIYFLQLFCIVSAIALLSACKDDEVELPVITEIRNYAASPNDTIVHTLNSDQWIVLIGKNLHEVSGIYFGGIPATVNGALTTDESIVVQIPSIPFQTVPRDKLNVVTVVNGSGSASVEIKITGNPIISHVRNYADSPNDTILNSVAPGQFINLVGFNLEGATSINFQGVDADLANVIYTDSSAIVKVPDDFSGGDASRANRITYTTRIGSSIYGIPIFDPAILEYYKDPLWTLLSGGIGNEKNWMIDFNAEGVSQKFAGPMWFSGDELRWSKECAKPGGNCWTYEPAWQTWMPGPKNYGTMTFKIKGVPVVPSVTVNQAGLADSKNGTFTGDYFLDVDKKTITFTGIVPLNMGWENAEWSKAYIITLTEDGMQLGFKHKSKTELELYNFILKE
ncbi:hypothetical protein ACFQ21_00610 [Ohtaekwangia kribbensis]|jgi:hypothetical protein|uniref:Surface glycan-binding protein B xyloglucan binding domain-containing protein n=1 Tax=Ohtaekwangia kribbensis TaxID=688913 RepID=A0ABW3JW80_9BACT